MGRNTLSLNTKNIEDLITKLDGIGADVQKVVTDALEQAAETITDDTLEVISDQYLPAHGKYHGKDGDTENSVVRNSKVTWVGGMASIPVGFDYNKPGAGGYLISGRPDMSPDVKLNQMYTGKKYMRQIEKDMVEVINDEIVRKMDA